MKRILWVSIGALGIAGVVYLATVGCCHLIGAGQRSISLTQQLGLTGAQSQAIAALEKNFLARKGASCQVLCAKRAQLIQLLKQPEPDQAALAVLTEEIGREQVALEKGTLEHLLAVRRHLEPAQREKLIGLMTEQLRTACRMTACGATEGCAVTEGKR